MSEIGHRLPVLPGENGLGKSTVSHNLAVASIMARRRVGRL